MADDNPRMASGGIIIVDHYFEQSEGTAIGAKSTAIVLISLSTFAEFTLLLTKTCLACDSYSLDVSVSKAKDELSPRLAAKNICKQIGNDEPQRFEHCA